MGTRRERPPVARGEYSQVRTRLERVHVPARHPVDCARFGADPDRPVRTDGDARHAVPDVDGSPGVAAVGTVLEAVLDRAREDAVAVGRETLHVVAGERLLGLPGAVDLAGAEQAVVEGRVDDHVGGSASAGY